MIPATELELVADKGVAGSKRYFGRRSILGEPTKRQVTLIEREQISEHAAALGVEFFAPGIVRSNIETEGIDLVPLEGKTLRIGAALVRVGKPRTPCAKMDQIMPGLRALMEDSRQGVLAQVIGSGTVRLGDEIRVED